MTETKAASAAQMRTLSPELAATLDRVRAAGPGGLLVCAASGALLHGFITPDDVAALGARVVVTAPGGVGHERDEVVMLAPELSPASVDLLRKIADRTYEAWEITIDAGRPLSAAGYIGCSFATYTITPAGRARLEVLP